MKEERVWEAGLSRGKVEDDFAPKSNVFHQSLKVPSSSCFQLDIRYNIT